MKVKLAMLVGNEALKSLVDAPMPSATSFRVAKAVKEVQKELEVFEESRQGLIKKYGKESKDGELSIEPESKNWEKFINEYNELVNEEVDINITKIKAENLSKVEISPKDIMMLEWLIDN